MAEIERTDFNSLLPLMETRDRSHSTLASFTLLLLSVVFVVAITLSLRWRFQHDAPILFYIAWAMDRFGSVPYRDIIDINMPGTYAFYCLIGKVSGYSDIGVRLVDLSILCTQLVLSYIWMKKFGEKVALCGAVLWGVCYLQLGPSVSLQREYLILLPLLAGVLISSKLQNDNATWKTFAVGFLFGIVALVKPHAAIALPLLLVFQVRSKRTTEFLVRIALPATLGFLVPTISGVLYLWHTNALDAFLDIALNYWPLYTQLSRDFQSLSGTARLKYFWRELHLVGGFGLWLIPSTIGTYIAFYRTDFPNFQKRQVVLLVVLTFCYGLYPFISGQFWGYHWLPFLFFVIQLSSLCLVELGSHAGRNERLIPIVVLFLSIVLSVLPPRGLAAAIQGRKTLPIKNGRVDEIADFLTSRIKPGDKVQPLDWTGGAVHAMLISQAELATPFIYDFYFYHNISEPYIQQLRQRFIESLRKSQARFILQITGEDKPWVYGDDTTREFIQLQALLDERYVRVAAGNGFQIYEIASLK